MSTFPQKMLDSAERRLGTSLRGKYAIERLLGVGAMAAVFAATHRNGARVAVKILHTELSNIKEIRARFVREGYIANRIAHPGVVRVLDDDVDDDGSAFLVMELIEGTTLEALWLAMDRRLPVTRAASIVDHLLDVLEAAHAAGVVHRDVKPDNILLTYDGKLKVFDFGIARLVGGSTVTRSGQMMGTPEFVAPEQAAGRVRDIDARSDLFSVGATLFTLLSGQFVHTARTSTEYMVYAATVPPRSILAAMPELDGGVANVIDVALAFEKEKRWASAREMQMALRSAVGTVGELMANTSAVGEPAQGADDRLLEPPAAPLSPARVASTATVRLGRMDLDAAEAEPMPLNRPRAKD